GVDEYVGLVEMPADDRPDFRREAMRVPSLRVVAELEVRAEYELPIVSVRHGEERAQLEAVEAKAEVLVVGVERQVEAGFEPPRHAKRPLGHAVPRLVGGDRAGERRLLDALRREVVVDR